MIGFGFKIRLANVTDVCDFKHLSPNMLNQIQLQLDSSKSSLFFYVDLQVAAIFI